MAPSQRVTPSASVRRDGASTRPSPNGLAFDVARTTDEVVEAWRLVYRSYLHAGLIGPNQAGIHTVRQAIGPTSAVICGRLNGLAVSTLTAYMDGRDGLPLDKVYSDELQALRDDGNILLELGLFADRRDQLQRSIEALLELMRFGTYFGVCIGATRGVIGVHPRHVGFYTRLLAFDVIGPEKTYPMVKNHPVVLLQLDWYAKTKLKKPPRGIVHFMENPLTAEAFQSRAQFDSVSLACSAIGTYLRCRCARKRAA